MFNINRNLALYHYKQSSIFRKIFVSFSSNTSNNALNNGSKVDTIFYADYPDSTFINKSIEEKNLSYKFDNDTYIYTLHNNKIIEEKVYLGNQKRTLFRKKNYYYKKGQLQKIKQFNMCCGNEERLPVDYVYFIYNNSNKLIFAVSVIDKKISHNDDKSVFGNEVNRNNFSISNIYKLEYSNTEIVITNLILEDIAIKTRDSKKLEKLYTLNRIQKKSTFKFKYTSNNHFLLVENIINILYPKIYIALYGYNGYYIKN